jgi:excisionase family DNA binding protein
MSEADRINLPDLSGEHLWTVRDVCAYLRKGRTWVYSEVAAERLPHLRVGHELRFDPDVIRAWARGEYPPAAAPIPIGNRRRL